jgi:hypothetical protein
MCYELIEVTVRQQSQQQRLHRYVDRILRAEKCPQTCQCGSQLNTPLVINLKTAKTLGLNIPLFALAVADNVIE